MQATFTIFIVFFFALFKFSCSVWTFAANLNRTKRIALFSLYQAYDYRVNVVRLVVNGPQQSVWRISCPHATAVNKKRVVKNPSLATTSM